MKNNYLNLYFNKINSSLYSIDEKEFSKSVKLIKKLNKKNKIILLEMEKRLMQIIALLISVNF